MRDENITVNKVVDLEKVFNDNFKPFYAHWVKGKYTYYVHKGGRNSAKSTHISLAIVLDIIDPKKNISALIGKRYGNSLEDTALPQIEWAMEVLGVSNLFKLNKKKLTYTYIPKEDIGCKIIFRGLDDPQRLKGLKNSKSPISILWIDELAQLKSEDELSNIENSILRDKIPNIKYKMVYSYNPPKRKHNWCNTKFESALLPPEYRVYHSTYLDNPHVTQEMIDKAEHLKATNKTRYDHEYLGLPIGNGVVPFSNLTFRKIDDFEIECIFDNLRQGLDFGYSAHPLCHGRMHWDNKNRRLYIFGEIYGVKIQNREYASILKEKGWDDIPIGADQAEPKSIDELKALGIPVWGVKKGRDSVEHGENWLDELEEIIIDPYRCPNIAREFEEIDYKTDRNGNILPKLEEENNHAVDMTRYSMGRDMKFRRKGLAKGDVISA